VKRLLASDKPHLVFATSRSAERVQSIPSRAVPIVCNTSSLTSIDEMVRRVAAESLAQQLPLSGVVFAGGTTLNKLFLRTSDEDINEMMENNLLVPLRVVRSVLKHSKMVTNRQGCFVALSSVVGEQGNAGQTAYCASKAALDGSFRALAKEYGNRNIRFNLVAPGLIESTMAAELNADQQETWKAAASLRRLGTPDEVAQVVVSVLDMTFVTGQTIRVCGGL
jgi:3-oxoacyl-[acyl-carrier protein] reductase